MDLQERKLNFIKKFHQINDEGLIDRLEQLLHSESNKAGDALEPISLEDFNHIIEQSERDFDAGNIDGARELLKKIDLLNKD